MVADRREHKELTRVSKDTFAIGKEKPNAFFALPNGE